MPTWSNLQSLIQLGVAINAAIFSVAALREPLVAREKEATDALTRQHDSMLAHPTVKQNPKWREFHSQWLRIRADFVECETLIEHWDKWIQWIAGVAAALSIIALVISAYRPSDTLEDCWVAVLAGLTVLPSLAAIGFNALFVRRKLDAIRQLRSQTDDHLADLYRDLG
jgi:hypothetical protein